MKRRIFVCDRLGGLHMQTYKKIPAGQAAGYKIRTHLIRSDLKQPALFVAQKPDSAEVCAIAAPN